MSFLVRSLPINRAVRVIAVTGRRPTHTSTSSAQVTKIDTTENDYLSAMAHRHTFPHLYPCPLVAKLKTESPTVKVDLTQLDPDELEYFNKMAVSHSKCESK